MQSIAHLLTVQPGWTFVLLGCSLVGLGQSGCSLGRRTVSNTELVSVVVRKDCARAGLRRSNLLVGWFDGADTNYVRYPDEASNPLDSSSLVQIGSATTAFYVPRFLAALDEAGMDSDSPALACTDFEITYERLLLHHAGLPVSGPWLERDIFGDFDLAQEAFCGSIREEDTASYRFSHWNYAVARLALEHDLGRSLAQELVTVPLSYALADSTRGDMPISASEDRPAGKGPVALFGPSTAGIASAEQLLRLASPQTAELLTGYPSAPTLRQRPGVRVTYGWHSLRKPGGLRVFLATGTTRYYSATLAYSPLTATGAVVVSNSGVPVDCVALDILRNLNQNWRRKP